MIKIANAQFWVHDQEKALAFYTRKLGWEVRADVTMEEWNFRWLVVGPAGQDDVGLVLMPVPASPMLDAESSTPARPVGRQGGRRHAVPRNRRLPGLLRRAFRTRCRLQRPTDAAALRHRYVVPGSLRQQHPPHPSARLLDGPPLRRQRRRPPAAGGAERRLGVPYAFDEWRFVEGWSGD
jgi:catechol 2,3-dioxygenase-like lactoylglutathione lyase family enzyme